MDQPRVVSVPLRGNGYETFLNLSQIKADPILVSVPLRGNGYETGSEPTLDAVKKIVSVPLRGNGYETKIYDWCDRQCRETEFPSPCGEMGMKLFPWSHYQS